MRSQKDFAELKKETATDPLGLGLVPNDDVVNEQKLNAPLLEVEADAIPSVKVFDSIVLSEWDALTDSQRLYLNTLMRFDTLDLTRGSGIAKTLKELFPVNSATWTNIKKLLKTKGSRIQQLYLEGKLDSPQAVTTSELADARRT